MWDAIVVWLNGAEGELSARFLAANAEEWIAFLGWIVAALTLLLAFISFNMQKSRERRVELQENYLRLELESNEVFRFEAAHGKVLEDYKEFERPGDWETRWDAAPGADEAAIAAKAAERAEVESIVDNFYLQQLNLFEIAARFRRDNVFADHIFGSWVIWYHDAARSWWFRDKWTREYSDNYTSDLYYIFTPMGQLLDALDKRLAERAGAPELSDQDDDPLAIAVKEVFFEHVSDLFHCPIVLEWLKRDPNGKKRRVHRGLELFGLWLSSPLWKLRSRVQSWFKSPLFTDEDDPSIGLLVDRVLKREKELRKQQEKAKQKRLRKSGAGSASASPSTPATSPTAKSSNPSPPMEKTGPPTPSS